MALTVKDDRSSSTYDGSGAAGPARDQRLHGLHDRLHLVRREAVLAPDIPNNEGVLRPIEITAPYGSIANSKPPAAGGARALIGHFFPMMVIQALSKRCPSG